MKIYLSCHHKTGTYYLRTLSQLFSKYDKNNRYILDNHSHLANRSSGKRKIIHIIRNPYEIITSGYFYHKKCTEKWCTNIWVSTNADNIRYNFNGLSYQEKLNKLNLEDGINFEMKGRSYNCIKDMCKFKHYNKKFCLNLKMEDLFDNPDDFLDKIINFLDIPELKNNDYSSLKMENNNKLNNHSTNKTRTTERHKEIFSEKNFIFFKKTFSEFCMENIGYKI